MLNKKEEKIFVDLDDEITFVVERIKSTDADRIVLVAPEGASIVSSLVSLKLLAKLLFKASKSLVLVTEDEAGVKFSQKAGIPVARKINEVSEEMWVESEEKIKRRGIHPVLGRKKDESISLPPEREGDSDSSGKASLSKTGEGVIEPVTETETVTDTETDTRLLPQMEGQVGGQAEPTLEEFGFVVDKDIAKEPIGISKAHEDGVPDFQEDPIPDDMTPPPSPKQEVQEEEKMYSTVLKDIERRESVSSVIEEAEEREELAIVGKDATGYEVVEPVSSKLMGVFKKFRLPKFKLSPKLLVPLVIFLIVLFGVGGVYAYFVAPTARIDLTVFHEIKEINNEIVATTEVSDVDLENLKIPLILQEVDESGSESTQVTSTEVRGEKAKGKVTIVNKTEAVIQLDSGTALTGSGYVFVLTQNEEIPAADIFAGTLGRAEIDVEAYDIGEEYNLASGTEFTVEGYTASALVGKSFESFSGGTKQEVTVVTADDQGRIKTTLEDKLKQRAEDKVREQVGDSFVLNDAMISVEVSEENFDHAVGDEADSLNLNMTVKAKAYVYSLEDIKTLGKQLLQGDVPEGSKLLEEQSEFNADFIRRENDSAVLNMKVKGVIVGDLNEDDIKDQLSGKKLVEAEETLGANESIESFEIFLGPDWLPSFLKHVPTIKSNVDVNIEVGEEGQ